MGSACHTRTNQPFGTNPHSVFQGNVSYHQIKRGFAVVVVSAQQHSTLRNAAVTSYVHRPQVVNPHTFTQPRIFTDTQVPGVFYIHPGFNHYTAANPGSKQLQQHFAPAITGDERHEQKRIAKMP
jgi:hypothetical protein